jgi:transposase
MDARRKFDEQFKEGAVRIVRETGKPVAQVARELGICDGTLGNWVNWLRGPGTAPHQCCR